MRLPAHEDFYRKWLLIMKMAQTVAVSNSTVEDTLVDRFDDSWPGRAITFDYLPTEAENDKPFCFVRRCLWVLPSGMEHIPGILRRFGADHIGPHSIDPATLEALTINGDPVDNFAVRRISDPAHPCRGQFGLFAARDIGFTPDEPCVKLNSKSRGSRGRARSKSGDAPVLSKLGLLLINYTGVYSLAMTKGNEDFASDGHSPYAFAIMSVPETNLFGRPDAQFTLSVEIDAEPMGNESRFINDYRCVAAKPNAYFLPYRDQSSPLNISLGVFLLRPIQAGEEILADYGPSYFPKEQYEAMKPQIQRVKDNEEMLEKEWALDRIMRVSTAAAYAIRPLCVSSPIDAIRNETAQIVFKDYMKLKDEKPHD
jgi:hypothetical protein